jgi:hypothetical protein
MRIVIIEIIMKAEIKLKICTFIKQCGVHVGHDFAVCAVTSEAVIII